MVSEPKMAGGADVADLCPRININIYIEAANGTDMPCTGWLEVTFKLTVMDDELLIPVLVLKVTNSNVQSLVSSYLNISCRTTRKANLNMETWTNL